MILLVLLGLFAGLSLIAIGGVASTLPAMARAVVAHHWMSAPQFAALFGLAQTSPGPNMLIATLIGLHVAGIAGALVATLGMIGPSSVLTVVVAGVWERFRAARWRLVLQAAITPVSGGLILAAALVVVRAADHGLRAWAITL
ncbi:MAG TPA: chromate transporter, partial [Acidiphilium sp.]|nr:chromate transporter [Acidiphilium sp.]